MKETVNQNTAAVSTANEFNVEVLKKRLYDLTPEEIRNNFKKVKCLLRRTKFGKGAKETVNYSAVLKFHDMCEVNFKLKPEEYLNVCLNRYPDSNVIPDSLTINAYYVAVKADRQDGSGSFYQIKVFLNKSVRLKGFLRPLQVDNILIIKNSGASSLKDFEFYDRPEFAEDDLDSRTLDELD